MTGVTELPIAPQVFWGGVTRLTAPSGLGLVYILLDQVGRDAPRQDPLAQAMQRLGLDDLPTPVFLVGLLLWAGLVAMLVAGLFSIIWSVIWFTFDPNSPAWEFRFLLAQMVALTTVLGALVALPVTLNLRMRACREAHATDLRLITDRLSTAIEKLGHKNS